MTRTFPLGAAFALAMSLVVGCSDTTVQSTPADDAFAMYSVDQTVTADFSEVPTVDDVLAKEGDPGRGRGEGRGDKGDRGWGRLETRPYQRILAQLHLTEEQTAAIRICFTEYRECVTSASTRYRAARTESHETLKAGLARVRAAVEGGTMTREEAGAAVKSLTEAYREQVKGLDTAFRAAIAACQTALEECIKGHLTEEQLVRWNRLHR